MAAAAVPRPISSNKTALIVRARRRFEGRAGRRRAARRLAAAAERDQGRYDEERGAEDAERAAGDARLEGIDADLRNSPSEYPRRAPAAVPRIRPAKTAGPESPSSSVVGGRRDLRPLRNFDEAVVTAPAIATAHKEKSPFDVCTPARPRVRRRTRGRRRRRRRRPSRWTRCAASGTRAPRCRSTCRT